MAAGEVTEASANAVLGLSATSVTEKVLAARLVRRMVPIGPTAMGGAMQAEVIEMLGLS